MNKKWIVATLVLIAAGLIAVKYLRPSQTGEPMTSSTGSSRSQPDLPRPTGTASRPGTSPL